MPNGPEHSPLVVLVEDHPLHARLLRHALCSRLPGCAVEVITDGVDAAQRLADPERPVPDLLVLDLDVPGRTGHELLAAGASDGRLAGVPAAVVSSSREPGDRMRSLALGARLHLLKPTDADGYGELAGRLAGLVRGR